MKILQNLRTPKLLTALEERTKQLFSDIQSIRDNWKQNITNTEKQRQKIQKGISSARRKMNSFLDKIEHDAGEFEHSRRKPNWRIG